MSTTALKIQKDGQETRLLFMTTPTKTGVDVDIFMADEEFIPVGSASIGVSQLSEDVYHTKLRVEAKERGQLVEEFCTDPEWNPGSENAEVTPG